MVEAMGLEPTNPLHAMQVLYQLSYAPGGEERYQRASVAHTHHIPNTRSYRTRSV